MSVLQGLVRWRRFRLVREILMLYGLDFPASVTTGSDLQLIHRGSGCVFHPKTRIGNRVQIYHQVTIGRADAHVPDQRSAMDWIEIGDDVVIFPGAKVLGGKGVTRIGNGTIIAANAVLIGSTGENEIWGGVPARRIGLRNRSELHQRIPPIL